jgi:hypothetical protein
LKIPLPDQFLSPSKESAAQMGPMYSKDRPQDLARRLAEIRARQRVREAFRRETFTLPREAARAKAREFFARYPKAAYLTSVESWRELPNGEIEFTLRRLPTAD